VQERATSSDWQTAFNAINVLCGVGLLTTPYAMAITGTSALLLLLFIGECCCSCCGSKVQGALMVALVGQ
jgi:amino acid permease